MTHYSRDAYLRDVDPDDCSTCSDTRTITVDSEGNQVEPWDEDNAVAVKPCPDCARPVAPRSVVGVPDDPWAKAGDWDETEVPF